MSRRLAAAVAAAILILAACGGGDDGGSATPTAPLRTPPTPGPVDTPQLGAAASISLFGAEPGDNATSIVLGDFNGDGSLDAAVGASLANGPSNQREDAGEVYVFLGPLERSTIRDAGMGEQSLTIYGGSAGDQAGRALASADVNGDSIDDLLIGAPMGDGPADDRVDAGEVHVVLGGSGLVPSSGLIDLATESPATIYGSDSEDLYGFALDAGDVNGDGTADIVGGAFWGDGPDEARGQAGEVAAVYGSPALTGARDLDTQPADSVVYGADTEGRLGETLALGDVNGDGQPDLVAAATFGPGTSGQSGAGRSYVILSPLPAVLDLSLTPAHATIVGRDEGDQLGHSLAIADNDGDGLGDILLGAVSADGLDNSVELAGEATLVLGSALTGIVDIAASGGTATIYGIDAEDRLGRSVGFLDYDGDGDSEAVLSAPGAAGMGNASANAGEVYVMQNQALAGDIQLPDLAVSYQGNAGDMSGSSVTGRPVLLAHDIDGDGREELIIGAPGSDGADGSRADAGAIFILFLA